MNVVDMFMYDYICLYFNIFHWKIDKSSFF